MTKRKHSPLHAILSLLVPGLGQIVAGFWQRGLSLLLSVLALGGLTIWTIGQEARFPDFALSLRLFIPLLLQAMALILFLLAVQRLLIRYVIRDNALRAFSNYIVWIVYAILLVLLAQPFLAIAGVGAHPRMIHEMTAVLSAGALGALWLWIAADAGQLGAARDLESAPSIINAILVACILIFVLGYAVTGIDLPKAVTEYQDTNVLLSRVSWPWRNAFEFQVDTVEVTQRIQGPCPEGATGPAPNEPHPSEPWVSVSPTCGQMTARDLQGNVTLGTELTVTGGNFPPGQELQILWKNPIGNPFEPRGVGDTRLTVGPDGAIESMMYFPEVVIASTSAGDQIHTLVLRQSSEEVFTGRLSEEMKLALNAMIETIMMALMATFFGIILAFPFSFLAARNLMAPIVSPLNEVIGSLLGIVAGGAIALFATGQFTQLMGGLERAPLLIFAVFMLLMIGLTLLGQRLGNTLYKRIQRSTGGTATLIATLLGVGLAMGTLGYLLGLGFSRGMLAIPLTAEVAAETEHLYAWGGAALGAIAGLAFGWRKRGVGEVRIGLLIYGVVRTALNIIRSIEPIIWGIVAIIWIGPGPFAGTIALTLHTIAALGKLYSESVESIDAGPIEALQATGANRLQTIIYAVIPQILPPFISFTIYRWDINVRMSTVIGLVGGGGIGFILIQWYRLFQYENVGIAVWLITLTVAAMDYISSNIRERYV